MKKILILFSALLLISCAHRPIEKKDAVYIGSIYSLEGEISAESQAEMTTLLSKELSALGFTDIRGPEKLQAVLGDDYEKLIQGFGNQEHLYLKIRNLHKLTPEVRGIVLARIEVDDLLYDRDQKKVASLDKKKGRFQITTETERDMKAWLEFIDLEENKVVVAKAHGIRLGHKSHYEDVLEEDDYIRFFRGIQQSVGKLFRTYKPDPNDDFVKRFPYPQGPNDQEMMGPIFSSFAQDIRQELAW